MSKRWMQWLAALAAGLLMAQGALAAPGRLTDVQWLQANLGRADVVLLDASPGSAHAKGHIPGAVSVDVFSFGAHDPSAAEMEQRIRSWGVSPGKTVVVYDPGGTYLATSLFFDLYYHGLPEASLLVLDGGLAKWLAAGGAVTKDPTPKPVPGTFRVAKVRDEVRVRMPEFLVATGDLTNHALVEALEPAQHYGAAKFFDRAGHIPHAVLAPAGDFFNADKTFKSPAEIRRMLGYLGITPDKQLNSHCGGGIAASVPFFAAKFLADYPKVKLYKESQLEWLRDDRGLPFWTYDAPNLARDKAWLAGWGSAMLRTFGVAKLSVIDVRPAEAFRKAHVPHAINIPADVFRRHLGSPAKLAEALGEAGVDPGFEAVIVSEGGLNSDSALAFLMLEAAGQKRVSVLADSVDDWAFAGLTLAKAGDATDGKKPAPTAYPTNLRTGLLVGEGQAARGAYPRVYLASGKVLPAKLPEGKVIHVPYADLVDEKGKPRAAKDLWTTLTKAGVPRYAEIVAFSDDPGEAAAAYVVLKMMGYPDIKVLAM